MLNLNFQKYNLIFKLPAGTSRGILKTKPSWFFILTTTNDKSKIAIGECGILPGLSYDDKPGYIDILKSIVKKVNAEQTLNIDFNLDEWPSIKFGFEMLKRDFQSKKDKILFESEFAQGNYHIPINGLIWMGDKQFMFEQIKKKIEEGWSCIKMKIGAIDFNEEISLLKYIRKQFIEKDIELRVDANGAFSKNDALEKLKKLSDLSLHSIEQPIKAGQIQDMAELCSKTPLKIALDEELIGINSPEEKEKLLKTISPHYIILKPSLTGGWKASEEWIDLAKSYNIKYWATSALESNIGLNAIAQWTATLEKNIVHGLGTGQLYTNNMESPLQVEKGFLSYNNSIYWNLSQLGL